MQCIKDICVIFVFLFLQFKYFFNQTELKKTVCRVISHGNNPSKMKTEPQKCKTVLANDLVAFP